MFRAKEAGIVHISIYINDLDDILKFNNYIPQELEEQIVTLIRNYPLDKKAKLVIYVCEDSKHFDAQKLIKLIHNHFTCRTRGIELTMEQQFKEWKVNLLIGILFLILCLILVEILESFSYIRVIKMIKESLMIISWVALWEPLNSILFGWRSTKRDKLYFKKLSMIPVRVVVKCK